MKKELYNAAHNALKICMALQPKEKLLVIFDAPEKQIGEALFVAGQELGAETLAIQIPELEFNGQEPPEEVAKLMQQMHAVICPTSKSLTHTDARRNACKANARVATMPNIQLETMIRGMSADYHRIASLSDKVAEILTAGNEAHLTTPKGTDIIIPIKDIEAISSRGLVTQAGTYGNLPSGEAFLMPIEGASQGRFIVDASMASIGKTDQDPIEIIVKDGMATDILGGDNARKLNASVDAVGPQGRNLAELGVGTNYMAEICGEILEDEKVLGTAHLAIGNNVSMGGTVNVKLHLDGVMFHPTLTIDGKLLLDNGRLLVDETSN
jgi:aminopeptidase